MVLVGHHIPWPPATFSAHRIHYGGCFAMPVELQPSKGPAVWPLTEMDHAPGVDECLLFHGVVFAHLIESLLDFFFARQPNKLWQLAWSVCNPLIL